MKHALRLASCWMVATTIALVSVTDGQAVPKVERFTAPYSDMVDGSGPRFNSPPAAILYTGCDYSGANVQVSAGQFADLAVLGEATTQQGFKSIQLLGDYTLSTYEDKNFGGSVGTVRESVRCNETPVRFNSVIASNSAQKMTNYGGLVMTNVNVYVVWYGSWTYRQIALTQYFLRNVDKTSWFNTARKSYNSQSVNFARSYIDRYSRGKTINFDASRTGDVYNIIKRFIDRKAFPVDPNGIYMVMASGDVEKKAFGTTYCGWHYNDYYGTTMLKYAFQGYDATGSSCTFPRGVSINNDAPLDTMISVTAHELIETMTDPLGDGWLDPSGKEVMDKCAWNYGQTTTILTGAKFTLAIGSQRYMVQTMWDNERLMCVNSG